MITVVSRRAVVAGTVSAATMALLGSPYAQGGGHVVMTPGEHVLDVEADGVDRFTLEFPPGASYQLVIRALKNEAAVSLDGSGHFPGDVFTLCGAEPTLLALDVQRVDTLSQWEWTFDWSDIGMEFDSVVEKNLPVQLSITVNATDMSCAECAGSTELDACIVGNWQLDGEDLQRLFQASGALCGVGSPPVTTGKVNVIFDEVGYFNILYHDVTAVAPGKRRGTVVTETSGMASGCYGIRRGRWSLDSADPRLHVERESVDSYIVSTTTERCGNNARSDTQELPSHAHLLAITIPSAYRCSDSLLDLGRTKYTRATQWSPIPDDRLTNRYLVVGSRLIEGRGRGRRTRTHPSPEGLESDSFERDARRDAIERANTTLQHQVESIEAGLKEMYEGARIILNVLPRDVVVWGDWQAPEDIDTGYTTVVTEDFLAHAVAPARVTYQIVIEPLSDSAASEP